MMTVAGWLAGLGTVLPVLAVVLASLLDLGPDGHVRFSLFPLVLVLYDSLLATSLVQSLAMAAAIVAGSTLIGVGLGTLLARFRFWGRPLLRGMLGGLSVVPPAFVAVGILGLGPSAGPAGGEFPFGWRWIAWAWAGLITGSGMVLEATIRELAASNPDWVEAARLAGAGRLRIWLELTWPRIRPGIVTAARGLFVLTLADPGPPLVLGLRRTLAFQIVASALGRDPFPRTAAVAVLLLAVSLAARALLRRRETSAWLDAGEPAPQVERDNWRATGAVPSRGVLAGLVVVFSLATAVAWMPALGLVRLAAQPGSPEPLSWSEAASLTWVCGQSVVMALSVAGALVLLPRLMPCERPGSRLDRWTRLALKIGELVPPLLTGVGVLAMVRLVFLGACCLGNAQGGLLTAVEPVGSWAGGLDPRGMSGPLVVLGVLLAHTPMRLLGQGVPTTGLEVCQGRIDQARLLGAGHVRALGLARAGARGIPVGLVVLWSVLAAISVAPAIVLGRPEPGWGIGPAVVTLAGGPGESRRQASGLALGAIGVSLAALALARGRKRLDA
jgi:ABC-type Fe3+ transport system permease subunit